jgi:hypothetical protein
MATDRPLGPDELAKMLGYSKNSLMSMRTKKSPIIADLPMFKLCDCESTRRKTQARCNHPYYAMESEVIAFFKRRQERFQQSQQQNQ